MSKSTKRKSGDASKNSKSLSSKDSNKRPSVFERLGTKATNLAVNLLTVNTSNLSEFCRHWAQNGNCPYGKNCKLSSSHILVSPSKRNSKKDKDSEFDKRLSSGVVRRTSPTDCAVDWESWDQSELEYEDEKALERRRQLLQRELELQMKKETQKLESTKRRSSSTSSDSSSSVSSSTSSASSSASSVNTVKKPEPRKSSTPPNFDWISAKKNMGKNVHKESPPRKRSSSKKSSPSLSRKASSRRKSNTPVRKPVSPPKAKLTSNRSSERERRKNDSPPSGSRGRSPDRKQSGGAGRSGGGSSRRSSPGRGSTSSTRRPRSPRSRVRTPDRRKDEDRRRKDDTRRGDRKTDFRDKRETAREKERLEALERCRERQREREALAKERERERKEREKRGRGSYRRSPREEKRAPTHDRKLERDRSYSRERARDRALERVMERRGSRERSYERPYSQNSPYRATATERRYAGERVSSERGGRDERRGNRRWVECREKSNREWSEHREWEPRSSRCEERGGGGDDWAGYSGSGGGVLPSGGGGGGDWRSRSHLSSHHEDRRSHHGDKEKEHTLQADISKDQLESSGLKRELEEEVEGSSGSVKKARLEETSLQEELSDISDDPDDILNREDTEFLERESCVDEEGGEDVSGCDRGGSQDREGPQPPRTPPPLNSRNIESQMEDDGMVGLDFEEISDEELEEESKSNKGASVSDALGVDWASLSAEWRPKRDSKEAGSSARIRWSTEAILSRLGVSAALAGEALSQRLATQYDAGAPEKSTNSEPIVSKLLQNKQALSARADVTIRRRLCGLPVINSETHPTTGLCQWAV